MRPVEQHNPHIHANVKENHRNHKPSDLHSQCHSPTQAREDSQVSPQLKNFPSDCHDLAPTAAMEGSATTLPGCSLLQSKDDATGHPFIMLPENPLLNFSAGIKADDLTTVSHRL